MIRARDGILPPAVQEEAPPPVSPTVTRPATPEEWERYGIRRPLRADLIEDLKAGLGLEAIAIRWDAPIKAVADKIRGGWYGIIRGMPNDKDAHARTVWQAAAVILGLKDTHPPVPQLKQPEPREEEREVSRPRGEIWTVLTADLLAEELETNTIKQVATKYGAAKSVIEHMIQEYGLIARGARPAARKAPKRKEAGSVADALPVDQATEPQETVAEAAPAVQVDLAGAQDGDKTALTVVDMAAKPSPPVEANPPAGPAPRGRYSAEHLEGRGLSVEVDQPALTPTSVRLFLQRVEDALALVGAEGHLSLTLTLRETA